jgi:hypothetical protein
MRSILRGFDVRGQTVAALTNLTRDPADVADAKELCGDLGGFVWANKNRRFGLQEIEVTGADGTVLSSRIGLTGKVR